MSTEQFNVRLDTETRQRIEQLCKELGVSQVDVIRLAIRLLWTKECKGK